MSTQFTPDNWLVSLHRAVKDYVETQINEYVKDDADLAAGLSVFQAVFEWPESDDLATSSELAKTTIHFIIDDIDSRKLGFGDDVVAGIEIPGGGVAADTVQPQEAQMHQINFDIGIWASDKSGGVTSRLVAYQMLQRILGSTSGRRAFQEGTGGIEVISFNGGRFITDRVNDVRVFRTIDSELVVRVFSRVIGGQLTIVDQEPLQSTGLEISDTVIV